MHRRLGMIKRHAKRIGMLFGVMLFSNAVFSNAAFAQLVVRDIFKDVDLYYGTGSAFNPGESGPFASLNALELSDGGIPLALNDLMALDAALDPRVIN